MRGMTSSSLMRKLHDSTVLWTGVYNGVRMVSGIILLPLLMRQLSDADLGMYYAFVSISQLAPVVDFGFSVSIGRFVSYAMGGAKELQAQGVGNQAGLGTPNYPLLWQLLVTTRRLYRWLSILAFVITGAAGTAWVGMRINETSDSHLAWLAWVLVLVSVVLEIYFSWWNTFLLGMNEVLYNARMGALMNILKLFLAAGLLLGGAGLMALPVATLVSSTLLRWLARRRCLELLDKQTRPDSFDTRALLAKLWPNTWRMGTLFLGAYAGNYAMQFFCTVYFGLKANAMLGVSLQLIGMVKTLSLVWTQVKWPAIGQYLARRDFALIRKTLRPAFLMQFVTLAVLSAIIVPAAPVCLSWLSATKQVLPLPWLLVLVANCAMDVQFTFWTTLMSMQNRLPFLWPTLITNGLSLCLALGLLRFTDFGIGALVLAPLAAGALFNYWYWALAGAATMETTWRRFVFEPAEGAPAL